MSESETLKYLNRRIEHAENRIDLIRTKQGDNASQTHTYHGGWSLGYWEGLCKAYKNTRDLLLESEATE